MEHLSPETLARLAEEAPGPTEREHLAACARCTAEVRAQRELVAALGDLPALRPPGGDWEILEARLLSEGLMEDGGRLRGSTLASTPGWMRSVAAAVLFLLGIGVGALSAGSLGRDAMRADLAFQPLLGETEAAAAGLDDAARRVELAEARYVEELVRYRQLSAAGDDGSPADPSGRIAALEHLVAAGQAALREAPADPFLNGLLASAVAEREAVLRHVSASDDQKWY